LLHFLQQGGGMLAGCWVKEPELQPLHSNRQLIVIF